MTPLSYRPARPGDESQISTCMRASATQSELTDGTPQGIAEWEQISGTEELGERIRSDEKTWVATHDGTVVGFIAFRRGSHLSLLFVRHDYAGRGIARELLTRCATGLDMITVNSSDLAVGFYRKIGFVETGERFHKDGGWSTPMRWTRAA